jgi:hypothetical protein
MKTKIIVLDTDNLNMIVEALEELYGDRAEIKKLSDAIDFEKEEIADLYFIQATFINRRIISLEEIVNKNSKIVAISAMDSFLEESKRIPFVHSVFNKIDIIDDRRDKRETQRLLNLLN